MYSRVPRQYSRTIPAYKPFDTPSDQQALFHSAL